MIRAGLGIAFIAMLLPVSNTWSAIIAGGGAGIFFVGVRRSSR